MIFIVVKFQVKPELADQWPEITREFTEATRAEPGNKWFDWSRSVEDPNEYVLVEAFDDDAAEAHVTSDHFLRAIAEGGPMHQALVSTPKIISRQIDGDGWDEMGEMQVG
ncbi:MULTISPECIES: putative quinol monooxygenase [unclassified Nesterenkonia]|uniref:putative quinol monooxygenase n=1 Tax=unclassified Nesterenkonia TaxID=2629769 RepID=UPI000872AC36|nr:MULTISPECIES: putative quinol monooxygenase [unclassified Nesterenkonia]MDS2172458.1 putative quinol monooxygenase [Nesterenkonia sp. CL21]OSM44490.1 antibiotic biosynthesis monooxygenase [Nesterenkonia sp. PF2B19]